MRKALFVLLVSLVAGVSCTRVEVEYPRDSHIAFVYTADADLPVQGFWGYIASVNYFIYDPAGHLYTSGSVTDPGIEGIRLSLPVSKYRIVCWGNLEHYNRAEQTGELSAARIVTGGADPAGVLQGSDPLYYAWADFTVKEESPDNKIELPFSNVHIPVWVYVRGFFNKDIPGYEQPPVIRLQGFASGFDFGGKPLQQTVSYDLPLTYDQSRDLLSGRSVVPRFDEQTPGLLNIYSAGEHRLLYSLSIKEYMAANNIRITGRKEAAVPILVEFFHEGISVSVSVRKPDWKEVEVSPVW